MGVLASTKTSSTAPGSAKRRSAQLDFSAIGPLKTGGTVGFSAFRDQDTEASRRRKARKKRSSNIGDSMNDSDDDEDEDSDMLGKMEDVEDKVLDTSKLAPEDARFQGELAEGVDRIRVSPRLHHST